MEWHLIFNNKRIVTMSKILLIFLFGAFLNSCQDSLGYDPHVNINPIGKDTTLLPPDDGNKPTVYIIDSIKASFKEVIRRRHRYYTFKWSGVTERKLIKFDTSNSKKKLWIEWTMKSKSKDSDYQPLRIDRIVGFEMKFAALLQTRTFLLDMNKDSRRWMMLKIKRTRTQKVFKFEQKSIKSKIIFIENDKQKGILKFMLSAQLPFHQPFQTKRFFGLVEIHYKKQ